MKLLFDMKTDLKIIERIDFRSDLSILNSLDDYSILVIGGAGTIGSNYIKKALRLRPKTLIVVDHNENSLTELTRDLRSSKLLDYNPEYITYPVNLLSETFDKIFWSDTFDLVANFSAHKHVRSDTRWPI